MNWASGITALVAVGGLVIAATNTWTALSDSRSSRFYERSQALRELRNAVAAEGQLTGPRASKSANLAHARLLLEFDQESRANAVLYLEATARLAKPGSLVKGIGQWMYGGLLILLAVRGFPPNPQETNAQAIAQLIVFYSFIAIALLLIGLGSRQIARRFKTRNLRKRVGALDDLTIEGSKWVRGVPSALGRKFRRRGSQT
jgi:hypothetical protein